MGARYISTWDQEVPPAPATSMAPTPASMRLAGGVCADAPADFFDDDGDGQRRADLCDLVEEAAPAGVAFRLDGFLQRVEMQDEGVCLHHIDGLAALVDAVAVVELDGSDIGKQKKIGRHVADAEGGGGFGALDAGALAAQAHGQAVALRGFGKGAVDGAGFVGAACHGADENGGREAFAEDRDGQVDVVQVQLGQGLVNEGVAFEAGGERGEADVLFQVDADVVCFAPFDGHRCGPLFIEICERSWVGGGIGWIRFQL